MQNVLGWGPSLDAKLRIRQKYTVFCQMNHLSPNEGHAAWVGQMKNSGLAAGTIRTYLRHVIGEKGRNLLQWQLVKGVEAWHASETTRHAPDLPLKDIIRFIQDLSESEGKNLLWLMAATGSRAADAARLTSEQVHIQCDGGRYTCLEIEWRLTKTARTRRQRVRTKYPVAWSCDPPKNFLDSLKRPGKIFHIIKVTKAADTATSLLEPIGLSSYSLRRAFIHQGLEILDDPTTVARMANHKPATLEAHYRQWDAKI